MLLEAPEVIHGRAEYFFCSRLFLNCFAPGESACFPSQRIEQFHASDGERFLSRRCWFEPSCASGATNAAGQLVHEPVGNHNAPSPFQRPFQFRARRVPRQPPDGAAGGYAGRAIQRRGRQPPHPVVCRAALLKLAAALRLECIFVRLRRTTGGSSAREFSVRSTVADFRTRTERMTFTSTRRGLGSRRTTAQAPVALNITSSSTP